MDLKSKIKKHLESNDFLKLEELYKTAKSKKFEKDLSFVAFEYPTLVSYTFLCMLLIKKESTELHVWSAVLLMQPLCHIEGAYAAALYHIRKAIALAPKNINLKESLLFLHEIPDQVVSKEEAIATAREILAKDPNRTCAKSLLKRYGLE